MPALKGLAETLLDQAVEFEADGFTGRLADGCRRALRLLVRAARLRPHSSCLWSLMGRVCLLLRCLAESTFEFSVPAVLLLADGGGESAAEDRLVAVTKRQVGGPPLWWVETSDAEYFAFFFHALPLLLHCGSIHSQSTPDPLLKSI